MDLLSTFNDIETPVVVSIVGGGGKTATMFELGKLLSDQSVLLTTTTKIIRPLNSDDYSIIDDRSLLASIEKEKPIVFGKPSSDYPGKLTGCSFDFIEEMTKEFQFIIVESDGSAGRPIKAPAHHEPVVSPLTKIYIGLIGLDCLGKKANDETVHRPEQFSKIRGKSISEPIVIDDLLKLINHKNGLFKNAPGDCHKIVLLNKADLLSLNEIKLIDRKMSQNIDFECKVIINSYLKPDWPDSAFS